MFSISRACGTLSMTTLKYDAQGTAVEWFPKTEDIFNHDKSMSVVTKDYVDQFRA